MGLSWSWTRRLSVTMIRGLLCLSLSTFLPHSGMYHVIAPFDVRSILQRMGPAPSFTHSSADGHFRLFPFGAVRNNAAVNVWVPIFARMLIFKCKGFRSCPSVIYFHLSHARACTRFRGQSLPRDGEAVRLCRCPACSLLGRRSSEWGAKKTVTSLTKWKQDDDKAEPPVGAGEARH